MGKEDILGRGNRGEKGVAFGVCREFDVAGAGLQLMSRPGTAVMVATEGVGW